MTFQIYQSTGSQKKRECQLEGLFEEDDGTSAMGWDGRWRRWISFHPFFCLKLFDFAQTQRTSYSIWIGYPQSLGFYHSRRVTYSIDYPQEPFRGNLYLFFLPVSGQKGQISGFCYCAEVWLRTSEHGILTEAALCRNRGLRGTFLATKLLNLAISLRSSQTFS